MNQPAPIVTPIAVPHGWLRAVMLNVINGQLQRRTLLFAARDVRQVQEMTPAPDNGMKACTAITLDQGAELMRAVLAESVTEFTSRWSLAWASSVLPAPEPFAAEATASAILAELSGRRPFKDIIVTLDRDVRADIHDALTALVRRALESST